MGKILLTGHKGYLGSVICKLFQDLGISIDTLDTKLEQIKPESLEYDIIIHCAGARRYRIDALISSNIEGMKYLLSGLKHKSKVLYISSAAVYSHQHEIGDLIEYASEDYPTDTRDNYGKTKLEAEKILITSPHDYLILRPVGIWGLGINNIGNPDIEFPAKLIKFAHENKTIQIYTPDRILHYIYVYDLADIILRLVFREDVWNNIYNIAGRERMLHSFVMQFINIFQNKTGKKVSYQYTEYPRCCFISMVKDKIANALGNIEYTEDEIVFSRMIDFYLSNGEKRVTWPPASLHFPGNHLANHF